ncbi:MAG: NAD(+)/NADH kinase [Nitrospirae bacterium]|nr:NAD(+)/NADH kinase [Nitrospirota bacterium]
MKKIGIIAKKNIPDSAKIIGNLISLLKKRNFMVCVESDAAAPLKIKGHSRGKVASCVDMIIVLGGDGTILNAAGLVGDRGTPILGVNLGGLGFITEITIDEIQAGIDKIISGQYDLEERIMLSAEVYRNKKKIFSASALNDVVINKSALARMIEFDTHIDKRHVTTLRADGLIVSTPTGSTAHSLSAGGPILYPTLETFVLTPICPHTLTNRPVVLPDNFVLEITIKTGDDVYLTLDGQIGFSLKAKDAVMVKKAGYKTRFIRFHERDYFQILREKLSWGER